MPLLTTEAPTLQPTQLGSFVNMQKTRDQDLPQNAKMVSGQPKDGPKMTQDDLKMALKWSRIASTQLKQIQNNYIDAQSNTKVPRLPHMFRARPQTPQHNFQDDPAKS